MLKGLFPEKKPQEVYMKRFIRIIVTVLMAFIVVHSVAARGGKEQAAEVQPAEFEFWTTETQSDRMSTIQLLVDTFQALNPQIKITVVPVDENDMPKQVAASAATGSRTPVLQHPRSGAISKRRPKPSTSRIRTSMGFWSVQKRRFTRSSVSPNLLFPTKPGSSIRTES